MKQPSLIQNAMAITLAFALSTSAAIAADGKSDTTSEKPHSHHDHAAMMAAMGDMPATKPALLPDASIYQLEARLTDQNGKVATFTDQAGDVRLVSMFYASCKYVCPMIIDQLKRIEHELDDEQHQRLRVSMITFDAKHDSPDVLTQLADERHIDSARWSLFQPRPSDVRPISALLGIQYRELPEGGFNHSSVISLIDADGRILARTEQLGASPDPAFVDAVRSALVKTGQADTGN